MRFAFIADTADWACHRQGMGLVKYGETEEHRWSLFHAEPRDFTRERLAGFDAVRVATASLFGQLISEEALPVGGPRLICSLASFQDAPRSRRVLRAHAEIIDAFAIVDHRLVSHCAGYGRPILPYIDRTDPEVFYPLRPRPTLEGPLRVGWAGSEKAWGRLKHVDLVEQACSWAGVDFVRQDRELDGVKDEAAMRAWFAGLDIYIAANEIETPTPVAQLEAAACGVPLVSTRCGILWPLLPTWAVVDRARSVDALAACLATANTVGREELRRQGLVFLAQNRYFLHWGEGEAEQHTEAVAALCRGMRV
jgi:hypothetical protein